MKIVGKLHDYYDGLMSYGQDDSLLFKRETIEFEGKKDPVILEIENLLSLDSFMRGSWRRHVHFPTGTLESGDGVKHTALPIFVGFCGKMYMGFEIEPQYTGNTSHAKYVMHSTKFVYSIFDTRKLEDNYSMFADYSRTKIPWLSNMIMHHQNVRKIDTSNFLIKHKIPYFVAQTKRGEISKVQFIPELKKCEFQKVKDPYSAYQEISMFLGGVIPRQIPEMVEISDKDRISQHGFNKLSFRHPIKFKRAK